MYMYYMYDSMACENDDGSKDAKRSSERSKGMVKLSPNCGIGYGGKLCRIHLSFILCLASTTARINFNCRRVVSRMAKCTVHTYPCIELCHSFRDSLHFEFYYVRSDMMYNLSRDTRFYYSFHLMQILSFYSFCFFIIFKLYSSLTLLPSCSPNFFLTIYNIFSILMLIIFFCSEKYCF